MRDWQEMLKRIENRKKTVKITITGKYVKLHDAYISVAEAIKHGGYENGYRIDINWVEAEEVTEDSAATIFKDSAGILVPGGFGDRGIEGKILAAEYARENDVPYLGICLGMQTAAIEFARNVLGISDACSAEFCEGGGNKVIDLMPDQYANIQKGGTMRLGAYPCLIEKDTLMHRAYGKEQIYERHRHRYEFNNDYRERFVAAGMKTAGTSPDGKLVEAVEISANRYFVGVQYHPEFKSRPNRAHPLFREFVKAAIEKVQKTAL